jgi:hypothetical protein
MTTLQEVLLADFDWLRSPGFAHLFQVLAADDPRLTAAAVTIAQLARGLPAPQVVTELDLAPVLSAVSAASANDVDLTAAAAGRTLPPEPVLLAWQSDGADWYEVEMLILAPPERVLWLECSRPGPVLILVDWARHRRVEAAP